MLDGINIEEVKKYNSSLKQYKEQAARLDVEIEVNEKELAQLCSQLSAELGIEVTPSNIENVYKEQVEKINNILETGNAILSKIESEAQGGVTQASAQPVTPVAPTAPTAPVAPVFGQSSPGQVFTGTSSNNGNVVLPQPGAQPSINGVPTTPLFSL